MKRDLIKDYPWFLRHHNHIRDNIIKALKKEARGSGSGNLMSYLTALLQAESRNVTRLSSTLLNRNPKYYHKLVREDVIRNLTEVYGQSLFPDSINTLLLEFIDDDLDDLDKSPYKLIYQELIEVILSLYGNALLDNCCVIGRFKTLRDFYIFIESASRLFFAIKSSSHLLLDLFQAKKAWESKLNYHVYAIANNVTKDYGSNDRLLVYELSRASYIERLRRYKIKCPTIPEVLKYENLLTNPTIESVCYKIIRREFAEMQTYFKNKTIGIQYAYIYKDLKTISLYISNPYLDKLIKILDKEVLEVIKK